MLDLSLKGDYLSVSLFTCDKIRFLCDKAQIFNTDQSLDFFEISPLDIVACKVLYPYKYMHLIFDIIFINFSSF